jgi:hypothetical protein
MAEPLEDPRVLSGYHFVPSFYADDHGQFPYRITDPYILMECAS